MREKYYRFSVNRETKETTFFIKSGGKWHEVSEKVAHEYKESKRREIYYETERKHGRPIYDDNGEIIGYTEAPEDSLERIEALGMPANRNQSSPVEAEVLKNMTIEKLHAALRHLPDDELALIRYMFFSGDTDKTERECCEHFNLKKSTFHDRKNKIFKKLRKFIEK